MKKYLYNYISEIEEKLKGNIKEKDIKELTDKISFFSHERLIHLLVTLFFGLISIIFTVLLFNYFSYFMCIITIILYIMVLFYVLHYYYLENGVQKLYKLYDQMYKKNK